MNTPELRDIPCDQIKVMISRARNKPLFEEMKASMADPKVGLRIPIQVIELKEPDKDGFLFHLIYGEGRLTAALDLKWKTIKAIVVNITDMQIAGRFLAENLIRKDTPFAQKGKWIRELMRASGKPVEEVAKSLHISLGHATKYLRILDKIAPELEEELEAMPMNTAEILTALPARGQKIVMEVVRDTQAPVKEIAQRAAKLQKQAKKERQGEGWTKAALEKALVATETALERARRKNKMLRRHYVFGPGNVETLLRTPAIRKALVAANVNLSKFPEA